MNVLIFSGGSGSDFLQQGLYKEFPELDITVLLNAYDNGKSTGAIRQVFNGNILGPSDIRKNQTRHWMMKNGKDSVYNFIEHRFTSKKPEEYIQKYFDSLDKSKNGYVLDELNGLVHEYFLTVDKSQNIEYDDFSIGNIIYGFLSHKLNNSLQSAADYMKGLLSLEQKVILNSDESLFLQAITDNGTILEDEADIVDYSNIENKITGIRFLDVDGNIKNNSFLCKRAIDAINNADLIIFSTGTQWSSLIPTYQCNTTTGQSFKEIINLAKAKKIFVMNGAADKDMIGLNGDNILDIIDEYINVEDLQVISGMTALTPKRYISHNVDLGGDKYDKSRLAKEIMWIYFDKPSTLDTYIFDYDDTIKGRNHTYPTYSQFNAENLPKNTYIVSGNSYKNIDLKQQAVYADGGANLYRFGSFIKCLDDNIFVDKYINIVQEFLDYYQFNGFRLENRNNVCLSIKPVDDTYRKVIADLLKTKFGPDYSVEPTGKTTIDIKHKNNNKLIAINDILCYNNQTVYYIGDELHYGNDKIVEENKKSLNIKTVNVKTPKDTTIFLKSIKD